MYNKLRMWLFVGGPPTNNLLVVGGPPTNNLLVVGGPPMNNLFLVGGPPTNNLLVVGDPLMGIPTTNDYEPSRGISHWGGRGMGVKCWCVNKVNTFLLRVRFVRRQVNCVGHPISHVHISRLRPQKCLYQ